MAEFKLKNSKSIARILGIIFFVLLFLFVVSTFFDYQISDELQKGMNFWIGRQLVDFVSIGGNFMPVFVGFIFLAVMVETIYKKKNISNVFVLWTPYVIVWMIAFCAYLYNILWFFAPLNISKDGQTAFIWLKTLAPLKEGAPSLFFWIVFQSFFLGYGTYYFRSTFAKYPNLVIDQYWVGAIKMVGVGLLTYFVVIVCKMFFGRPFFYSVIFKELYGISSNNTLTMFDNLTIDNYQNYPAAKVFIDLYMENNNNDFELAKISYQNSVLAMSLGPAPERADNWSYWFIPNNPIKNLIRWLPFVEKAPAPAIDENGNILWSDQWFNNDFPSGHIAASVWVYAILFVIKANKPKLNFTWKINLFIVMVTLYAFATIFGMVIYRFHWMTDMLFTPMIFILSVPLINKIVNKWISKRTNYSQKAKFKTSN